MFTAPRNGASNPHIEATDSHFNTPIFKKQNATLNCSIITSNNMKIKDLEWEFPEKVVKVIITNRYLFHFYRINNSYLCLQKIMIENIAFEFSVLIMRLKMTKKIIHVK